MSILIDKIAIVEKGNHHYHDYNNENIYEKINADHDQLQHEEL